jgi:hypothetical protein
MGCMGWTGIFCVVSHTSFDEVIGICAVLIFLSCKSTCNRDFFQLQMGLKMRFSSCKSRRNLFFLPKCK